LSFLSAAPPAGLSAAAVQCAYRSKYRDSNSNAYSLDSFARFYQHDFLTPVLSNMLGSDIWASATSCHLWNRPFGDTGNLWEGFGKDALHISLDQDFNGVMGYQPSEPCPL